MPFEEILYRGFGPHQRKGGGFSTLGVSSEDEMQRALADGWYRTLADAIEAHDNPAAAQAQAETDVPDDDAPVTRAELEANAEKLGVKFDGRTSDSALLRKIKRALG